MKISDIKIVTGLNTQLEYIRGDVKTVNEFNSDDAIGILGCQTKIFINNDHIGFIGAKNHILNAVLDVLRARELWTLAELKKYDIVE